MEYTSPLDALETQSQTINLKIAPAKSRITNSIIDTITFYLLYLALGSFSYSRLGIDTEINPLHDLFLLVVSHFIVYALTELIFQKTLGKFLTRTTVVNVLGEKPSFKSILGRTCCRLIPCEAFSFIFLEIGLHDKFSKTRVIID